MSTGATYPVALDVNATAAVAALDANPAVGSLRIGIGYDVHAFAAAEDGRRLVLGGVDIAYQRGLLGHSDADVLTHAVADALLGAARAGDIGQHFPDTDPRFAGADSLLLLAEVGELLGARGWRVLDLDCVIIAQEPKMAPYRDSMRANIAAALRIPTDAVGVKATTTEGLGFEGRGQGIAAQAVALIAGGLGSIANRTPSTPIASAALASTAGTGRCCR
jgi:2-C-methyl-D-erythritol 2,4-cyclodiphosphate synthase